MIYADNAATTQMDKEAYEDMQSILVNMYGNASEPYSFSRPLKKLLKQAREDIAECIHAEPEEIYFTSGGTESDNWALKGLILPIIHRHPHIVTSEIEHHAVLRSCKSLERLGCVIDLVPVDGNGLVDPICLRKKLTASTEMASIMFSNNEVGTIEPIRNLVEISHARNIIFHTDAVQAIGHVPVDVKKLGIDMLSASGHKFNAPKGIGFLYLRKGIKLMPLHDGGAQEFGMRAGTENVAAIVAMAKALKINCEKIEEHCNLLKHLEDVLLDELDANKVEYFRNGHANRVPGNLSLSFPGFEGEMLLHRLDLKGICVATGSACNSERAEISHVLKAMNIPERNAIGTIRVSFGRYNKEEDARQIGQAIAHITGHHKHR